MSFEFVQIVYDDEQKKHCYRFARIHFNEKLTIFYENDVIKRVVDASKADKISVCSWRLKEKMRYYIGRPREITPELLDSDYQVLSFTKNTKHHQMLAMAYRQHPGFEIAFNKILSKIGIPCPNEVKFPIYQNHFSASRETYQDYVKRYLSPAMDVMQNDTEINKLIMSDSNYSKLKKADLQEPQRLMDQIGVPYYPLSPFILERLFSVYVHNNKIPVQWL